MKIRIKKVGSKFLVNAVDKCGAHYSGVGSTMDASIGDFVRYYQKDFGLEIEVDVSAQKTEKDRQRRELTKA